VFTESDVEIVSPRPVLDEVRAYLPVLADRYAILPQALESQFQLLAVRSVDPVFYRRQIPEARRRMKFRDPDDVDLLALALALRVPVWSNDGDFSAVRVAWYTTARLLAKLGTGKQ
jgi:predicted nucleic acid-binding protein